jgi:heterodisulfide reductase subunit A
MDAGRHPRIEILRCAELLALDGQAGAFKATVRRNPTGVDEAACTACGACRAVCKFEAPSAFDAGVGTRKAIDRPFPQSVPAAYAIDFDLCRKCKRCLKACPRDAIDLDAQPVDQVLDVGAVVLATGFDEFDPSVLRNYGYGVYPNIVTSLQLERLLNASGPTLGRVGRPSDTKAPRDLIFVQCVGARGEAGRPYCSRYCCMNAVKDALLVRQHDPDVNSVTILYTDMRAFGKGHDDLYERARSQPWVNFVRGRPAKIMERGDTHDLEVYVEDTESGRQQRLSADMVVLSCAGTPANGTAELAARLGIETTAMGFVATTAADSAVATSRSGVFACGSAMGPQVIPDCVAQGSAAAAEAAILLGHRPRKTAEDLPSSDKAPPAAEEMLESAVPGGSGAAPEPARAAPQASADDLPEDPRIGVFLCHCGINIAGVLDMEELLAHARQLPGVVVASQELFACSSTSQDAIRQAISEHQLNRVVVAACTPRTHEPIFRENCRGAGLNPYLLEMVNIRDQCSWVHAALPAEATRKARDLLGMAVARARRLEPLTPTEVGVSQKVLVIGGGLSGMKAASDLRALGFAVTLVEHRGEVGGLVTQLHSLYPDRHEAHRSIVAFLDRLRTSGVDLRLGTELRGVSGFVGNFRAQLGPALDSDAPGEEIEVGAIVIALGAEAYTPAKGEFGYGEFDNVITSTELEARLADPDRGLADVRSVAFVQCVGSRRATTGGDSPAGYPGCSRICCPTTVKQALQLSERGIDSIVFYRDMRMVGCGAEEMYREARRQGAVFVRYDKGEAPRVTGRKNQATAVTAQDTLLRAQVSAPVDLVVLAVGLAPRKTEAAHIQEMLKTPRGADGFFLERHPELGPVETCVDGVVVCGAAQGPKDIRDSLAQASAAATKVATLLGSGRLYLDPAVCEVNSELCRACGLCVSLCEFGAPSLSQAADGSPAATINPALCKGCGTCAVWCPTGAIDAHHFTDQQITAMIDTLFQVETP